MQTLTRPERTFKVRALFDGAGAKDPRQRGYAGEKKARFGRWFVVEKGALSGRALQAKHGPGQQLRGPGVGNKFFLPPHTRLGEGRSVSSTLMVIDENRFFVGIAAATGGGV